MRIISGKYRGRNLVSFEGKDIRPTIDRVKESIFNVIQFGIANSRFIDLFAGTGSMGIEAISRGAKEVIFSDNANSSLNILKQNLKGIEGEYKILNRDYREALNSIVEKVDYIFVDAPYALDCILDIVKIIKARDLFTQDSYLIYEHDDTKEYTLPKDFYIEKTKVFGKVVVDYIKLSQKVCAVTGSYDPITLGHISVIEDALKEFDKVVVLIAQNEQKGVFFTFDERKKIAEAALKEYKNVIVEICEGYVFSFLNQNNIDIIARGYRTQQDYDYEVEMAKYNEEHGKIKTILYKAKDDSVDISSTKVRDALKNNEEIRGLVPKNTVKLIKRIYEDKKLWSNKVLKNT